jgi:RNA polymerase sigma-70 factor (ECF subfamily)
MPEMDRHEPSDTALVRAARANPDAFCALYDRNVKPLLAWLLSQTGDVEVAMDLVAETFAIALRSLTSFRGERPASGRAWLYGIALRLLLRHRETALLERKTRARLRVSRALKTLREALQGDAT